ncbi:hypothetical protein [Streptomyces lydicus]|uniref:hypothetical protein n=1 Tax=Streptomyces lydicus TaxID=47763 RepID=UPI0013DD98E6|nr:hypothetical protein [Streptomyces lydicus]
MSIFIVTASILVALTEGNPWAIRVPRTARIGDAGPDHRQAATRLSSNDRMTTGATGVQ